MYIRTATETDLNRILEIYSTARVFMARNGNPRQWGMTNWPPRELVENDIRQKKCHVCVDNDRVVAVFYYDFGTDIEKCYQNIDGNWILSSAYGVVHRIATDHSVPGIGTYCIRWAIEKARHLRIDTHPDNTIMRNLLKKLGFRYCGIIHVDEDPDPRLAFETADWIKMSTTCKI